MNSANNIKNTRVGLVLLSRLSEEGKKIFSTSDAMKIASEMQISPKYLKVALSLLMRDEWIIPIRRGLYALSKGFSTDPLHEFQIAIALVQHGAISHWSALHYHGLSDQIPRKIFVTTIDKSIPRIAHQKFGNVIINGISYVFTRVKKERFFGIQNVWINQTKIPITDLEKTLLDGLSKPQYCGDFGEVFHAFQVIGDKLDLKKIISYALQIDVATIKRLGWILSNIGFNENELSQLLQVKVKAFQKLNTSGTNTGNFNSKWMIRENFYG